MTRSQALPISSALACALVLGNCSDQSGDETTTPAQTNVTRTSEPVVTSETSDDVEQTTTASPELSAEEQDEADIDETLRLYTDALSAAFNGDASVEGIYPFSRDTARDKWVTEVMAAEAQGFAFSGLMRVDIIEVNISGDTAEAVGCLDVSGIEAVDENGKSILAEERLDRTVQDYVLERDDSAQAGWYVVEDTNRNEPCDG